MHPNIFTHEIAKYLSVPLDLAESIQNVIDEYFYLDWSEADEFEMRSVFIAAYEFYKSSLIKRQGPHTCGVFHSLTKTCG